MALIVNETRGDVVDLQYYGHIALVDASGKKLWGVGDPNRVTYSRSSAKPMQAIPVIESGAADRYGITQEELAVMCASHAGDDGHVQAVVSILEKAGLHEGYLQCGSHEPMSADMMAKHRNESITPVAVHNNCSGKHAGMLITAKALGGNIKDYYRPEHPIQEEITRIIAQTCDHDAAHIKLGVDGCGVPVHAMPLHKFAHGYARMSVPQVLGPDREKTAQRITSAMINNPWMVGGTNNFTSELMKMFGDRLFCKYGANAFFAIGLKESGIGIAMKIEGGQSCAIPLASVAVLEKISAISAEEADSARKLNSYLSAKYVKNHRGEIIGQRETIFDLGTVNQ